MNQTTRQAYIDKMSARIEEWGATLNVIKARAKGVSANIKLMYGKFKDRIKETKEETKYV